MRKYLTFDIGGTDLKYGIIDENFNIIYKNKTATEAKNGGKFILNKIITLSKELQKEHQVEGIALSTAGVVNSDTGEVLDATNAIPDYIGINIINYLKEHLNMNVSVENDVNCMGLCEGSLGASKGQKQAIALTVGTGIGGCILFDGKIYPGASYSAGEWGMMTIQGDIYEEVASTRALVKSFKEVFGEEIHSGLDVFRLYDQKNETAVSLVNQFYNKLSIGIANLIYALNPNMVVIGGGITARESFIEELIPHIQGRLTEPLKKVTKIVAASYKNDAGMVGAFINFKQKHNI